ncbi:tripartite tricarboxylate transporter TctB family protein [Acidaminobacter hydrogenoformans]|uniref:Tripartite tricarboxylate transporter TctB family protein n=1 Tax=Acidaminobacter hydrogenoformans DSM 2784 TaxID=1120920 RepID=A0A1G5RZ81_9FIRM|nr:tripartite tricarboxylate transporter TctB family protein [Acidaminobacter hydrogenoformans]SCZ79306.1 Tripartite tricarboxylate transporter TctB family protein [Acidaminobacter hydrogenoformans DSM 2784]
MNGKSGLNNIDKQTLKDREESNTSKSQTKFQPGEKGFAVFLFIFGSFFTYQSVLMYQKAPGASSYAAVPLFVSVLIMIFSALIFIFDYKAESVNHDQPTGEKVKRSLSYIFQKDVLVMMGLILLYSIALRYKLGFYFVTPVFLWLSMSYLMRKNLVKNILWTALSLLFIFMVFSFAFRVVLP